MSKFEIFIVVLILVFIGLSIIVACFEAEKDKKERENIKANIERCKECVYCKMFDYSSETVYCEKVDKGGFIEPLENCKYCRTSVDKTTGEIIDMYLALFDEFDNEV